jgi:hypothetical protein
LLQYSFLVWPFDPHVRKVLIEWPWLNPTPLDVAVEMSGEYIRLDPFSPDAPKLIALQAKYIEMQKKANLMRGGMNDPLKRAQLLPSPPPTR